MNTDNLIDVLSANLEQVSRGQLSRTVLLAMTVGAVASFGLMFTTVGPRSDPYSIAHLEWLAVKLFFALSVTGTGMPFLIKSIRPGLENEPRSVLIFLPFFAALAVAFGMLLFVRPETWMAMLLGTTTVSPVRCFLCIASFAAIPLAALIWALRQGAPTRLRSCGAIAGIVAGGLGAAAYALACTTNTVPFIAIWYSAAIGLCAIVGALLGPRLVRW